MKIDITPNDLALTITLLMNHCHLMEVVEAEYGSTKEGRRETQEQITKIRELASRLQAHRIIR